PVNPEEVRDGEAAIASTFASANPSCGGRGRVRSRALSPHFLRFSPPPPLRKTLITSPSAKCSGVNPAYPRGKPHLPVASPPCTRDITLSRTRNLKLP